MRYVLLLLLLCFSFVVLNSVSKYRTPLSLFATGSAAPSGSKSYDVNGRTRAAYNRVSNTPLKGGPSAGTGLHSVSAPATAIAAKPITETIGNQDDVVISSVDATNIGTLSSTELTPVSVAVKTSTVPDKTSIAPVKTTTSIGRTSTQTPIITSIGMTAPIGVHHQPVTTVVAVPTVNSSTIAASETVHTEESAPVAVKTATVATPGTIQTADLSSDMATGTNDMDLSSQPSMNSDVKPALSPFQLSAMARARASFIADSIRNSLMDPHGIQFGGIAGLNMSGASATSTTGRVGGSPLSGFALGAFADIPVAKNLSFRPQVLYSYEGYQPKINGENVNVHVAYLSTPLDMVYHTNLLKKRFFMGAGPYMAYAMNGTYTEKGINADMQFGNNYNGGDNLRKMDYGVNIMAGVLLDRNFVFGATFDLGLSNIAPSGAVSQIRTRSVGLSIAYVFRNKANTKTY